MNDVIEFEDGTFINADCMDVMKDMQDKQFDLCLTDPPYGGGGGGSRNGKRSRAPVSEVSLTSMRLKRQEQAERGRKNIRKEAKIYSIGIMLRIKKLLTNFSEYQRIRSSGAETILKCHRLGVSLSGIN